MFSCIYCDAKVTGVTNTRFHGRYARRTRRCTSCNRRFQTMEMADRDFVIIKRILDLANIYRKKGDINGQDEAPSGASHPGEIREP